MNAALPTLAAAATDLPNEWLLARASGLLAYLVLTLTVVAGLTLRGRLLGRTVSPAVVTAVHRTLSFVGIGAVALHGLLLAIDTSVDVPLVSLVVPGLAGYRPVATGIGVMAAELWLLVHLSFRMRRHIGVKRWRALHMLSFPTWLLAAGHGIFAGSDSGLAWVQTMYAGSIAVVVGLLAIRMASRRSAPARRTMPASTSPPPPGPRTPAARPASHASHTAAPNAA